MVAVAVLVSVVLAGELRNGTHRDEIAITTKPTRADQAKQALAPLLARGTPLTDDETAALRPSRHVTEIIGNLRRAWTIPPPPGAEDQIWILMPASNRSGSACLDINTGGMDERGAVACGDAKLLTTTGIGTTRIVRAQDSPGLYAPGGRAHFSGIVPSNVTSIVVLDTDRRVAKRIDVTGQTYTFDIATEDLGSIEYRDAEGRAMAVTPILDQRRQPQHKPGTPG